MTRNNVNKRLRNEEVNTNSYNEYFTIGNTNNKLYYYGLYEDLCIEEDKRECRKTTTVY